MSIFKIGFEGAIEKFPENLKKELIIFKSDKPLFAQLLDFPLDSEFELHFPKELSQQSKLEIHKQFKNANYCRIITAKTFDEHLLPWVYNSFKNYEIIKNKSIPLRGLPNYVTSNRCIVVGNGGSLRGVSASFFTNADVFCCYHSFPKLFRLKVHPFLVGHLDRMKPFYDFEEIKNHDPVNLLVTPSVCPEIFKISHDKIFSYMDKGNPVNTLMASALNFEENDFVVGTVVNFLTQAAIFSGYEYIEFIGVDFSDPTEEEIKSYSEPGVEIIKEKNQYGKTYYTHQVYSQYKAGLEEIISKSNSKFINHSKIGVDIKGCL